MTTLKKIPRVATGFQTYFVNSLWAFFFFFFFFFFYFNNVIAYKIEKFMNKS